MLCFTEGLFVLHMKDLICKVIKMGIGQIVATEDSMDKTEVGPSMNKIKEEETSEET